MTYASTRRKIERQAIAQKAREIAKKARANVTPEGVFTAEQAAEEIARTNELKRQSAERVARYAAEHGITLEGGNG